MAVKVSFEIVAREEGEMGEILDLSRPATKIPYSMAEVMEVIRNLSFVAETVAHLKGMERTILPTTDKARAILKAFNAE